MSTLLHIPLFDYNWARFCRTVHCHLLKHWKKKRNGITTKQTIHKVRSLSWRSGDNKSGEENRKSLWNCHLFMPFGGLTTVQEKTRSVGKIITPTSIKTEWVCMALLLVLARNIYLFRAMKCPKWRFSNNMRQEGMSGTTIDYQEDKGKFLNNVALQHQVTATLLNYIQASLKQI